MQRRDAPSSPPRGFSFVEALVLVAIVGTLVVLLLPMLQRARESARQATCSDHCRRFGMALAAYEDAKEEFPPGSDAFTPDRAKQPPRLLAWSALVLPFLDELPVAVAIDYAKPWNDPAGNLAAAGTSLAVYVCPSGVQRYPGKQDYGGVMGTAVKRSAVESLVDDWEHAGVLYATDAAHPRPVRRDMITDGLAQTLLVAEAVDRGTFGDDGAPMPVADASSALWACGTSCILLSSRVVNDPAVDAFWSTHPGGIECLFADGHVVFLTDSVDADVLVALVTKAGGEEVPVGF
jgi:prepilin-type processing-associated H-X9-DG protein